MLAWLAVTAVMTTELYSVVMTEAVTAAVTAVMTTAGVTSFDWKPGVFQNTPANST